MQRVAMQSEKVEVKIDITNGDRQYSESWELDQVHPQILGNDGAYTGQIVASLFFIIEKEAADPSVVLCGDGIDWELRYFDIFAKAHQDFNVFFTDASNETQIVDACFKFMEMNDKTYNLRKLRKSRFVKALLDPCVEKIIVPVFERGPDGKLGHWYVAEFRGFGAFLNGNVEQPQIFVFDSLAQFEPAIRKVDAEQSKLHNFCYNVRPMRVYSFFYKLHYAIPLLISFYDAKFAYCKQVLKMQCLVPYNFPNQIVPGNDCGPFIILIAQLCAKKIITNSRDGGLVKFPVSELQVTDGNVISKSESRKLRASQWRMLLKYATKGAEAMYAALRRSEQASLAADGLNAYCN